VTTLRPWVAAALIAAIATVILPGGSEAASPPITTPQVTATTPLLASTPLPGFGLYRGQMLVDSDPEAPYVFVSEGNGGSNIAMLGFDGSVLDEASGLSSPSGMVIDGTTLYVAECGGAAIKRFTIGTDQLTASGQISLGIDPGTGHAFTTSCALAESNGRLWFGNYPTGGSLYSVDPAVGTPDGTSNISIGELFATSGAASTRLFNAEAYSLYGLDTTNPTATVGFFDNSVYGTNAWDLSASPAGDRVALAADQPHLVAEYSAADGTKLHNYHSGYYGRSGFYGSQAVAYSPNGSHLALGSAQLHPDILIYALGGSIPTRTYSFKSVGQYLAPRGLAWAPDSSRLFTVTADGIHGTFGSPVFRVLDRPLMIQPTIAVFAPATVYGQSRKVTVRLSAHGLNRRVVVYKRPYGGSWSMLAAGNVGSGGTFTVKFAPKRLTFLYATYAGGGKYLPAASPHVGMYVQPIVKRSLTGFYAISGRTYLFRSGTDPRIFGTILPVHAGACLHFEVSHYASGRWTSPNRSPCFRMNSAGTAAAYYVGPFGRWVPYRQRVYFGGDADHTSARSTWIYMTAT
jgi:hypothetical protein